MAPARLTLLAIVSVALCSCRPTPAGVALTPPFNEETVVARASTAWKRGPGDGLWTYELTVNSRLADRLFVRVERLRALSADGRVLGTDEARAERVLAPHAACAVMRGEVRISEPVEPSGFSIDSSAVPLSALGQALYREWRMAEGRVASETLDRELKEMASAPPCEFP